MKEEINMQDDIREQLIKQFPSDVVEILDQSGFRRRAREGRTPDKGRIYGFLGCR